MLLPLKVIRCRPVGTTVWQYVTGDDLLTTDPEMAHRLVADDAEAETMTYQGEWTGWEFQAVTIEQAREEQSGD